MFWLCSGGTSVELCINKLYEAAVKSEFKANCEKFDSGLGELGTLDVLADSCVSSVMACWKGAERLVNWSSPNTKREAGVQRRIFIFGALGYLKLALLEGLRRLVLTTLTEQVVPIHNHIALFWIPSIPGTKTVIMKSTKKPRVNLSDNTPIQGRIQPVSLGRGRFQ